MVGFISEPKVEEEQGDSNQVSNIKSCKDAIDFFEPKIEDLSLIDSFLDFDAINWLEDVPNLDVSTLEGTSFGFSESGKDMEMIREGSSGETLVENQITSGSGGNVGKSEPFDDGSEPIVNRSESVASKGSEQIGSGPICLPEMKADGENLKTGEGMCCSIEEEMGKVSLAEEGDSVANDGDEGESDSESESEITSSSSFAIKSSCNQEEEEEEEKAELEAMIDSNQADGVAIEYEEGEIKDADGKESHKIDDEDSDEEDDENDDGDNDDDDNDNDDDDDNDDDVVEAMVAWSDAEEESDFGQQIREPVRSKNELKELPPVPRVDVCLEPHHTVLPVGVVLSIIGTKVIVEGVEKHNPLNEGSILWITESRSPLGLVDEIFGPVKNPYYVVRYNSESEVPAGICQGSSVSFVAEFADYVLNNKDLYKKGYDVSGENDEELSDEFEFSDDEKEAEFKRMQRMEKRGMNEQKPGNIKNNKKKMNNRDRSHQQVIRVAQKTDNGAPLPPKPTNSDQRNVLPNSDQRNILPSTQPFDRRNSQFSTTTGQAITAGSPLVPPFQQMPPAGGFAPNGMQPNGNPFYGGFPQNGMLSFPQNNQWNPYPVQTPFQMPMQNQMAVSNPMLFQQQFVPGQVSFPNMVLPGGQANLNFFARPSPGPWPRMAEQNCFDLTTFGIGLHGQPSNATLNAANIEQNSNLQACAINPVNFEARPQFSMGASSSHGRRPYHRGGGRFGRGRGRHQSG